MIPIFDLYRQFRSEANTPQGGFARPGTFQDWVNAISLELFRETFKDWEKNQRISDELGGPFLKSYNVVLQNIPGAPHDFFVKPQDYEYYSSAYIVLPRNSEVGVRTPGLDCIDGKTGRKYVDADDVAVAAQSAGGDLIEQKISKVDNGRWGSVAGHKISKPSLSNPFMTQIDGGFKVIPKGVGVIRLNYLRSPEPCVFDYTIDPITDAVLFNPAGSKDLEWSAVMINEFIVRLKKKYASFTGNEMMYQQGLQEQKDIA